MNLSQQIKQYADYEDTHSAPISLNAHALWKQVAELEAALAASKANNQKYCITIAELEAERDRLEERLDDWQRETALAKAERDRLKAEMAYDEEHIKSLRTELSEQIKQKWPMRMDYLINQVSDLEKDRDRLREKLKEANSGAAYQAGKQDGYNAGLEAAAQEMIAKFYPAQKYVEVVQALKEKT